MERIVDVVRERVALPHRRRVSVDVGTGVAGAPTRILIDPVPSARYFHRDDEAH